MIITKSMRRAGRSLRRRLVVITLPVDATMRSREHLASEMSKVKSVDFLILPHGYSSQVAQ